MPIFFQHDVDDNTRLAIWHITEDATFFSDKVPLHRDITHPHKKLQHLAGRYLLCYLFPEFPTALIRIADTKKPFLENEAYHFSISHCGDFAAVIVSRSNRVGIDIEIPTDKVLKILPKFLHIQEHEMLNGLEDQLQTATILWSSKEAMFKWWGRGQVDFSEMLRLSGNIKTNNGQINGRFHKDRVDQEFPIRFHSFSGLVLAYIVTPVIDQAF